MSPEPDSARSAEATGSVTERHSGEFPDARSGRLRRLAREARSWPTVLLMLICLLVGLPSVVLLTPEQELHILGQTVSVGAREPRLSLSGPAQLVQVGNTSYDLVKLNVYGPLRPKISLGPVQRNAAASQALNPETANGVGTDAVRTLIGGFLRWYLWGALGMVVFALAASALVGCLRMLLHLRRQSRAPVDRGTVIVLWHRLSGTIIRMSVLALAVSLLAWAASGALAYWGTTRGLANVTSLADLTGATRVSPSPVGPERHGYSGAVIGDSRASRVGGPPPPDASPQDVACARSTDSLAAELALLRSTPVLNLACSGASIPVGLRQPQDKNGVTVPAQVGLLKQVRGLEFVVVAIGPNDLYWSDFLSYCYTQASCDDRLTEGEFSYRLAAFDQEYAGLLQDLNDLPDNPKVVIVTSYDPFYPEADASCPDVRGWPGIPGLDQRKIELLHERNAQLNAVLEAGARKYGFAVAKPDLSGLCAPPSDGLGPDLQGLDQPHPFHPTGLGSVRLAASVAQELARVLPQPTR